MTSSNYRRGRTERLRKEPIQFFNQSIGMKFAPNCTEQSKLDESISVIQGIDSEIIYTDEQSFDVESRNASQDQLVSKPRRQRSSRLQQDEKQKSGRPSEIGRVRWVSGIKPETVNNGRNLSKVNPAHQSTQGSLNEYEAVARKTLDLVYEELLSSQQCCSDTEEPTSELE